MIFDWFEINGYADEIEEPVDVRYLCEQNTIILRPNRTYHFKVDETCRKCTDLASVYDERYQRGNLPQDSNPV